MSPSQKVLLLLLVAAEGSRLSLRQMLQEEALLEQPPQMTDTLSVPQVASIPQQWYKQQVPQPAPQQLTQMPQVAAAPPQLPPAPPQMPPAPQAAPVPLPQMPSVPQVQAPVPVPKRAVPVQSSPVQALVSAATNPVLAAPVAPVATPVAPVAAPVAPVMPQQQAAAPTDQAIDMNTVGGDNPTNAFVQLKELQTEFEQISANDQTHMRKVLFNVQLRQVLKKKLKAELQRLDDDNEFLQGAIGRVKEMEAAEHGGEAMAPATNKALVQLRKKLSQTGGPSSEQIAHSVLEHMQQMAGGVGQIRMNDEHEIAALIANSQARNHLERTIEQQKRKLDSDSGVLLKDLSKIVSLTGESQGRPVAKAFIAAPAATAVEPLPALQPLDDSSAPLA